MSFFDRSHTKVLLIGSTNFPNDPDITPVPNIEINLQLLENCLKNPQTVGIPKINIEISLNDNLFILKDKLHAITEGTRNAKYTLIVYFAGHAMYSSTDGGYYLLTHSSKTNHLENGSINVDDFKKYINRSLADRKIIIMDCCHSGSVIDKLGSMESKLQVEIEEFKGTYVMTSSARKEFSLFPNKEPTLPTYFTGKLIDVIKNGIANDKEYCDLGDIFIEIENDFIERNLPIPQQSSFKKGQNIAFSRNVKFNSKKADELAWEKIKNQKNKWSFMDFKDKFPLSQFAKEAKIRFFDIEDNEAWGEVCDIDEAYAYDDYIDKFKNGKYVTPAKKRLARLKDEGKEKMHWDEVINLNNIFLFQEYLVKYPNGKFIDIASSKISELNKINESAIKFNKQKKDWDIIRELDNISKFKEYIINYPDGAFTHDAQTQLSYLQAEQRESDAYRAALKQNQISDIESYIQAFPKGRFVSDAKKELSRMQRQKEKLENQKKKINEHQYWEDITVKNNKGLFSKYLSQYPNGDFAEEAKKKIVEFDDNEAWRLAKNINDINSYVSYIEEFKNGLYIIEAKAAILHLKDLEIEKQKISEAEKRKIQDAQKKKKDDEKKYYEEILIKNNKKFFFEYLSKYPNGNFINIVRNKIAQIEDDEAWDKANELNSNNSYSEYIDKSNNEFRIRQANKNIIILKKLEEEENNINAFVKATPEKVKESSAFWFSIRCSLAMGLIFVIFYTIDNGLTFFSLETLYIFIKSFLISFLIVWSIGLIGWARLALKKK